ncbi:hypothetical protein [Bacteroides uniformis]|uniref:hypothetical protein n=2 Tax=Bacteroides TaxID=816 RepID=UPI00232C93D9|nr:hypothetical protein [Bacteroides uniformis]MDC1767473.1 hypothetical protein [Bacteroides uniformis]MDC1771097.1 hypothetical protein [Bacteroides uniformis]MDC1777335.1 hypothetical protein [Bacteroides uniformis]MDC1778766.1 hypothetical protein [Bacteroides uniformis]
MLEMETLFPELTAAEQEVYLLILQEKMFNGACVMLGEEESTVTSTQTYIRKKLTLQPSDNLRKALQERKK